MFLTLLSQIALFGILTLGVMAVNAIVFGWLGGRWGVLAGQLYQALFVLHVDLVIVPGQLNAAFVGVWITHVMMVNLLLLPAWILGLLLRQRHRQRLRDKARPRVVSGS